MPDTPQRGERELHELFQVLRDHVVEVVEEFGEQVNQRLLYAEERPLETAPSARALASGFLVQLLNLLSGLLGAGRPQDSLNGADDEP